MEIKIQVKGDADAKRKVKDLQKTVDTSSKSIASGVFKANVAFEALKVGISAAVTMAEKMATTGINFAKSALAQASSLQQNRIALETMLKAQVGVNKAEERTIKLLKDLQKFAAQTPFNLGELQDYTKELTAYGIKVDDIIPTLDKLGNVSAGVGKDKLPQLILAFGQVSAKGKLAGQELLQFTNTGVPLVATLAEMKNVSKEMIYELTSKGLITFKDVENAFARMTAEGGMYNGLMDQLSGTLSGVQSNLQDTADTFMRFAGGIDEGGTLIEGGLLDVVNEKLQDVQKLLLDNTGKATDFAKSISKSMGSRIGSVMQFGIDIVTGEGSAISQQVRSTLESLFETINTFFDGIDWTLVMPIMDNLLSIVNSMIEPLGNLLDIGLKIVNDILEIAEPILTPLFEILSDVFEILEPFLPLLKPILEVGLYPLKKALEALAPVFNLVNEAINGLLTTLGLVANKAQQEANAKLDKANKDLDMALRASDTAKLMKAQGITPKFDGSRIINVPKNLKNYYENTRAYASGGVVGGNSWSGDMIGARVNSGEMILNREQQTELFRLLSRNSSKNVNFNAPISFGGQRGDMQEKNNFTNLLLKTL